jgi:hypothetical protein
VHCVHRCFLHGWRERRSFWWCCWIGKNARWSRRGGGRRKSSVVGVSGEGRAASRLTLVGRSRLWIEGTETMTTFPLRDGRGEGCPRLSLLPLTASNHVERRTARRSKPRRSHPSRGQVEPDGTAQTPPAAPSNSPTSLPAPPRHPHAVTKGGSLSGGSFRQWEGRAEGGNEVG